MNLSLRPSFFAILSGLLLWLPSLPSRAEDDPKVTAHPAAKVVREYLQLVLQRDWNKSAALVEPLSLKQLHADFLIRLKKAPTMDDEQLMTKRVGKETYTEVENMAPISFYTAYHEGLQERWKVSPEVIKKVRDSLTIRLLSLGEEDPSHVHILVRTKHSTDKALIENLELLSLVKIDGAWKIALNEQAPKVTPLESALAPAPPSAEPEKKPVDPVKPAPKPPVKAKTN